MKEEEFTRPRVEKPKAFCLHFPPPHPPPSPPPPAFQTRNRLCCVTFPCCAIRSGLRSSSGTGGLLRWLGFAVVTRRLGLAVNIILIYIDSQIPHQIESLINIRWCIVIPEATAQLPRIYFL